MRVRAHRMDFVECLLKRLKMSVSALENKCKRAKYVLLKVFNKLRNQNL